MIYSGDSCLCPYVQDCCSVYFQTVHNILNCMTANKNPVSCFSGQSLATERSAFRSWHAEGCVLCSALEIKVLGHCYMYFSTGLEHKSRVMFVWGLRSVVKIVLHETLPQHHTLHLICSISMISEKS